MEVLNFNKAVEIVESVTKEDIGDLVLAVLEGYVTSDSVWDGINDRMRILTEDCLREEFQHLDRDVYHVAWDMAASYIANRICNFEALDEYMNESLEYVKGNAIEDLLG